MQYASYKKKILLLNKFLNFIYRIRFVILALFLAFTTTIVTLNSVTGTSVHFINQLNNKVIYGESYDFLPESILNAAYVEYREIHENEWKEERPINVGTYIARSYSYNGWNAKVIGEEFKFTIEPKEVTLFSKQKTLIYGNSLNFENDGLNKGDKISDITFKFDENYYKDDPFGSNESFECETIFDLDSIVITNGNDEDVTSNYVFSDKKNIVEIFKRPLNIKTKNENYVYDGTIHASSDYETVNGTELANGDKIEILSTTEVKEIESKNNEFLDFKILSEDGYNRTAFYKISFDYGTLNVSKRKLKVTTSDLIKTYDGKPFEESKFEVNITEGELLKNHELSFDFDHIANFEACDETLNSISNFKIIDTANENADVSSYYDFVVNNGKFLINKKPLSIECETLSKKYDGEVLYGNYLYDNLELAEGDKLIFDSTPENISEVGSLNYETPVYKILNSDGIDVTQSYLITTIEGSLKILKRNLVLKSNSYNRIYNGHKVLNSELNVDYESEGDSLSSNHQIEFTFENVDKYIQSATKNNFTYKIKDIEGNKIDVNKYYNVTVEYGDFEIKKQDLTISTPSRSKIYTGASQLNNEYSQVGLVDSTDYINFTKSEVVETEPGVYENYREFTIINNELGGIDVADCYNIDKDFGKFSINKNTIYFKSNSYNAVYAGKELEAGEGKELKFSYEFEETVDPSITVVASLDYANKNVASFIETKVENSITYRIYKNEEDVTDNFNLDTSNCGTIYVSKAPLTFTSPSNSFEYDGNYHNDLDYSADGLKGDDKITLVDLDESSFIHEGTHENRINYNIYSSNEEDSFNVTACYELTNIYNNITISKRPLYVDFTNCVFNETYSGSYYSFNQYDYSFVGTTLAPNESVTIKLKNGLENSFIDVGIYPYQSYFDFSIYNELYEYDATSNYDLTLIYSNAVISKRALEIKITDKEFYYTGEEHIANTFMITKGSLASDDYLDINSDKFKDATNGAKPFNATVKIQNSILKRDVTSNYDLKLTDGTIDIKKDNLYINLTGINKYYDGTDVFKGNFYSYYAEHYENIEQTILRNKDIKLGNSSICDNVLYEFAPSDFALYDLDNKDITSNFNIILLGEARFSILPQLLNFYLNEEDYHFLYDGVTRSLKRNLKYSGTLQNDDKVEIVNYIDVEARDLADSGKEITPLNKENIKIIDGKTGEDHTGNYSIIINISNPLYYQILGKSITLSSTTIEKTFDNKPFDISSFTVEMSGTLSSNEKIEYEFLNKDVKDVHKDGAYPNEFKYTITNIDTGEDVSSNYLVNTNIGSIFIYPIEVKYNVKAYKQKYNGKVVSSGFNDTYYEMSDKSVFIRLDYTSFTDLKEVGEVQVYAEFNTPVGEIINAGTYEFPFIIHVLIDGIDYTDSMNISINSGDTSLTFDIYKLTLEVFNYGDTYEYGDTMIDETLEFGGDYEVMIKMGHKLYFGDEEYDPNKDDYELLNMIEKGTYNYEELKYFFDTIKVLDKDGNDVTSNYELDFTYFENYIIV